MILQKYPKMGISLFLCQKDLTKKVLLLFVFQVLVISNLFAQVNVITVNPGKTGHGILTIHGPNIALYDQSVPSRHKLILMLQGTRSRSENMRKIDSTFATMGYNAISLDYENNVITAGICAHSPNKGCYNNYHEEIIFGKQVSNKVKVDKTNSIIHRFRQLMIFLEEKYPQDGWKEFYKNGNFMWNRIIVAGHSQGSGHAAYFGKKFKLDRVLIFSGPQDYRKDLNRPAGWLSKKGATPPNRYFAFLNIHDPFDFHHQLANCDLLMRRTKFDTTMVKPGLSIHSDQHILVTDKPIKHAHNSTLYLRFKNVWKYMLTTPEYLK